MAELFPSDTTLNGLSGTTDAEQAVPYIPVGLSPYHTEFYKMLYRLLDVARRAGDLRVYKDDAGALKFGVRPGKWFNGNTPVDYEGAASQDLTDNAVNYVYLSAAGVLTVNTTGFPAPSTTPHIPLATIATGTEGIAGVAGQYDHADITDFRGRALLTVPAGLTPAEVAEAAAFFTTTDITGAEAETLTDGSDADALHAHAGLLGKALAEAKLFIGSAGGIATAQDLGGDASIDATGVVTIADEAVTNAKCAPDMALARSKLATETSVVYRIPFTACAQENGDHIAGGYPGPGSGDFGLTTLGWGGSSIYLSAAVIQGGTETSTLCFEFICPPEYVAGTNLTFVVRAYYFGSGTPGTTTIDIEAYDVVDGTYGSDINATAAQNLTSSWADYSFTITGTGLAVGDRVLIFVRMVVQETGGSNALRGQLSDMEIQTSIKG